MSKYFDVCIRGDGVVGRTLALLLAQQRLRVALVAAPAMPTPEGQAPMDVRAYALNKASRELLQGLRAWPDSAANTPAVTPVQQMRVWGDDGGQLDFTAADAGHESLAWIVDVPALEQQLAEAVRYAPQIERLDAPAKAALTVVCEGKKSSSRADFGVHWTSKPYGQKAIAARLASDLPHQGVARQWFSGGDVLALLPLGGDGGNSVALVWSVSMERAAQLESLTDDDFCRELQSACNEKTGGEASALRLISPRSSWPLSLATADHWVGQGWALAGDAAHTVHPLAGQGLNLGLADVATLAEVLAGREYWRELGDERLLRRYERARKADVAAMGAVTDGLHSLFAQPDSRWQALRNWGMKGFARSGFLKNWVAQRAAG